MNADKVTTERLRRVAHLINLPDPLPPVEEIKRLVQQRIDQFKTELAQDTPKSTVNLLRRVETKMSIPVLELKLAEINELFPDIRPIPPIPPISPTSDPGKNISA